MMVKKLSLCLRIAAVVVILLVSAPSLACKTSPPPEVTVTVGEANLPEQWLPNLMILDYASVGLHFYDLLLTADEKGMPAPGLATKWEMSPDGKVWTFWLRKEVQFHDNWGELTAEDVKFSAELAGKEGSVSPALPNFKNMERIEAVDPYTIRFSFKKPIWDWHYRQTPMLPYLPIVSKKYYEGVGEQKAAEYPIGSGPFQVVEVEKGNYMKLKAVKNHWRVTPDYDYLVFKKVPEPATRLAMLAAGDLDITQLPTSLKLEIEAAKLRLSPIPAFGNFIYVYLGGQHYTKRQSDPKAYDPTVPWTLPDKEKALKVRMALNLAVDKQAIIDKILLGEAEPSLFPYYLPGYPWSDPSWKPYPYDPNKAKQLLTEAGYPKGFEMTMLLVDWPGRAGLSDVGEAVAMYWEKNLGLKVKREVVEYTPFLKILGQRYTVGAAWTYAPGARPEPAVSTPLTWHTNVGRNYIMEDKWLDEMLDKASTTTNPEERWKIQKDMGQFVYDGYYTVPIAFQKVSYAIGPKIKEYKPYAGAQYGGGMEYATVNR